MSRQRLPSDRGHRFELRVVGGRRPQRGRNGRQVGARPARGRGRSRQDVTIEDGKISDYRVRLGISFKYDSGD